MKRLLLPALLLAAPAVASADEAVLRLCVESPRRDEAAARRLDAWLTNARVDLQTAPCAPSQPGRYVGRFVKDARGVIFVLGTPKGGRLERRVPWLSAVDAPLDRLSSAGRLSEFSVLVEALVAEDRLGLTLLDEPPPPRPSKPKPRPAQRPKPKPAPVAEVTPPMQEPPPTPAPPAEPPPAPPPPAPAPPAVAAQPSKPKPPPVVIPPLPPTPPFWADWTLRADAFGAMRWRSPGVLAPETGVSLHYGPLLARGAWQLPARWDLEGRALDIEALSLQAGASLPVAEAPGATLELAAGGVAESLGIREVYAGATDFQAHWDAGPFAGLQADFELGSGLGLGLLGEVEWLPTARRVLIPPGWPAATINAVSVRAAVALSYGR